MSEFKFACPVCGQHITCDSGSSGSSMACPTCFRNLVVPQATAPGASTLVLSASEVQTRATPLPGNGEARAVPKKEFPWAALALGLVLCLAATAAFVFRARILSAYQQAVRVAINAPPAAPKPEVAAVPATSWTLNLAEAKIPATTAAGQISGQSFTLPGATIVSDLLILWPGTTWPPDAGVALSLSQFAKKAEELADKTIIIETTRTNAPRILLRWKDEQGQSVTRDFHEGYALRVEFGSLTGTRLPGKIFVAAPDEAKSYVAGTFELEIRKPSATKPKPKPQP